VGAGEVALASLYKWKRETIIIFLFSQSISDSCVGGKGVMREQLLNSTFSQIKSNWRNPSSHPKKGDQMQALGEIKRGI